MRIVITDPEIVNAVYAYKVHMQAISFLGGYMMTLEDAEEIVKRGDRLDYHAWGLIAAQHPEITEPGWTRSIDVFNRVIMEKPEE